jgi:colanic acid/amylovoran biosynthesis glycosyltransferase
LKPIPISVIVGQYLPFSETFVYDQLMNQKQFEANVLSYQHAESASRFPYDKVTCLESLERKLYFTLGRSKSFEKAIEESKSKLIHAHFGTNGVYGVHFANKFDLPLVTTFHGHDVSGLLKQNRFTGRYARYQLFYDKLRQRGDLFLPASQDLADTVIHKFGIKEDRVKIHRLGIDLNKFSYSAREEKPVEILMVGRFVEKKGFEYALKAYGEVLKKEPSFKNSKLRIVGNGPLKEDYLKIIGEYKLDYQIEFLGALTSEELKNKMLQSDVLMAPSVIAANGDLESGLIVLKEAAATGLATIGTYHGGLPEIIDNEKTGFLVKERNVQELSGRLYDLMSDYNLRQTMGVAARAKMENEYDTLKQNEILESHFKSVL